MSPSRIRYVTACQQLLALGVVLAVLVPAAAVVSLDVIREAPAAGTDTSTGLGGSDPGADPATPVVDEVAAAGQRRSRALARDRKVADATRRSAVVPEEAVDPQVTEVPLQPAGRSTRESRTPAPAQDEQPPAEEPAPPAADTTTDTTTDTAEPAASEVVSDPQPVTGYGAVGVTWAPTTDVPEDAIAVQVRTRTDGTWSGWQDVEYHDDHGPDPGSAEAAGVRPGTDEALVGHVDDVQVKVATSDGVALPDDLSLAVVDPGTTSDVDVEEPALAPTGETTAPSSTTTSASTDTQPAAGTAGAPADGLALSAATQVAAPTIYSRAQWGADEKLRDQSAPTYGVIKGGFVHHTVNANDYTADEVPAIIRSIYAYHVKSRGWRDIGYNFLVDRFGRIWEGRYGGVDRPVQGAHTSGYNDEAFAMSAIGNFDLVQPSADVIRAYSQLFAWKLAISGVSAAATNVAISGKTFASSIMGHRDAGQTACPGQYLYAQLPAIRTGAAQAQNGMLLGPGFTGRALSSDLVGTGWPDLVVRRASDGRGVLLPTEGTTRYTGPVKVSSGWKSAKRVLLTTDITGDGREDLLLVGRNGVPRVRPGTGTGGFKATKPVSRVLKGYSQLTAVGDLDRDGRGDLVGRTSTGRLVVFHGAKGRTFTTTTAQGSWKGYDLLAGAGDVTGDGRDDLVARDRKNKLWLFKGTKKGLGKRTKVAGSWGRYDAVLGGGDHDGDGRDDLLVRQSRTGEVFLRPGLGKGAFAPAIGPVARIKGVDQLSSGRVGADGRPDLVGRAGNKLVRLDNAGTHETSAPVETNLDLSGATAVLNAGDLDGDGVGDVVVRDAAGTLTLRPGAGGGSFGAPITIGTGFGAVTDLAAVADRTGDGRPDLVGSLNGATTVWAGQGRSALGGAVPDAAYAKVPSGSDLSSYDWVVPISDGDGDGVPDLLARRAATGQLFLLPGGDTLGTPRLLVGGLQGYDLAG